jgi:hypothetical protein
VIKANSVRIYKEPESMIALIAALTILTPFDPPRGPGGGMEILGYAQSDIAHMIPAIFDPSLEIMMTSIVGTTFSVPGGWRADRTSSTSLSSYAGNTSLSFKNSSLSDVVVFDLFVTAHAEGGYSGGGHAGSSTNISIISAYGSGPSYSNSAQIIHEQILMPQQQVILSGSISGETGE